VNIDSLLPDPVAIHEPQGETAPVVATLPHAGRLIPEPLAAKIKLPIERLWSDWYTWELYSFLPSLGVRTLVARYSPFVANVNRDPDGELLGGWWRAVVPVITPWNEDVYTEAPSLGEARERLKHLHVPFHQALDSSLDSLVRVYGRVLLLDLHSFGMPLDEDVVIGDSHGKTARSEVVELIEVELRRQGLSVSRNNRFSGGWITRKFATNPQVDAILVEVNQRLYLDYQEFQPPSPNPSRIEQAQTVLRPVLQRVTRQFT
jgi:N-formylglutamate deformylase